MYVVKHIPRANMRAPLPLSPSADQTPKADRHATPTPLTHHHAASHLPLASASSRGLSATAITDFARWPRRTRTTTNCRFVQSLSVFRPPDNKRPSVEDSNEDEKSKMVIHVEKEEPQSFFNHCLGVTKKSTVKHRRFTDIEREFLTELYKEDQLHERKSREDTDVHISGHGKPLSDQQVTDRVYRFKRTLKKVGASI